MKKHTKSMADFIREQRTVLVAHITAQRNKGRVGTKLESPPLTNNDIHEWILNDPGLFHWAKSEGVNV